MGEFLHVLSIIFISMGVSMITTAACVVAEEWYKQWRRNRK